MILVTGGAGYIGSHTCIELLNAGHPLVIFDNFSNSHHEVIERVETITGQKIQLVKGDIRDQQALERTLIHFSCNAVIHFAGLKAVGDSVKNPIEYYDNNVVGTHRLLTAMKNCGVNKIIFSSSATVYGDPQFLPLTEDHPLRATNPYGRSKLIVEEMLRDLHQADPKWRIAILRYFNPVGAHHSGLIGEDPQGIPNNLMPLVSQVAVGRREFLNIWGDDYPTHDGTGVRDFIHVVDLALGHIKALDQLDKLECSAINLGTGIGYSVLDIVKTFEKVSSRTIAYERCSRRIGDVAACYADPALAKQLLMWTSQRDLATMCRDHWRWQSQNINGYKLG